MTTIQGSRWARADATPAEDDPKRLAYIAELIRTLLEGRKITAAYNVALLALLALFSALHWRRRRLDHKRWRHRLQAARADCCNGHGPTDLDSRFSGQPWSSSSTIGGATTPLGKDVDVERLPLLAHGPLASRPRPTPVVNRALPHNAVSVSVLGWLGLNAAFFAFRCPSGGDFLFVPADRTGFVFIVNLPLLYLLAAKNQPIRLLTGRSYEALNVFHRRVGETMCLVAALHLAGMLLFQFVLAPDWLNLVSAAEYLLHPRSLLGFGALVAYELLYLTSLASLRRRCYELFLASHVVLQLVALAFLYLHFYTSRPYVCASLAIFVLDRLVWRMRVKSATVVADVRILADGETLVVSAEWDVPASGNRSCGILAGWRPADHVFVTIPALGRTHALQAHPFTVASAAPTPTTTRARLDILMRTHSGFTSHLLEHVRQRSTHPTAPPVRVSVRLDGPYGSPHALDMLRPSDAAVLVAGGSGIAVVYPLAAALLADDQHNTARKRQRVHLLWVTRSRSHLSWIPAERLQGLVAAGLDLLVSEPTEEAGRPATADIMRGWMGTGDSRRVGVAISGPEGLNREVRNVCATGISKGSNIRVTVEKFGLVA